MLDNIFIKKLSLDSKLVDQDKSYIRFDSNTNNNIIELYLNKETDIYCDKCNSKNIVIRGSKITTNKTSFPDANQVVVNVHRRIHKCCDCNHTFIQPNPLSFYGKKITIQKDVHILNALRDKSRTYSAIAKDFNVSVSYVVNLFDRHVDLKRQSMPYVLCIDEVYAKKLVKNSYCCILYAPQWKKIVDILDSRHKLDLIDYFARIPLEEKNKVQFVSMDLYLSTKSRQIK